MNPLTENDIALAQSIVNDAPALIEFFAHCKNCGANTDQQIAQVQALAEFAANVLREFGGRQ